METIDILAYPAGEPELRRHPLPLEEPGSRCTVQLRCLPGASHLHVLLRSGERVRYRAEIPAEGGEKIELSVAMDPSGAIEMDCPGREVLRLPEIPSITPTTRPIVPHECREYLELALVVDGTSRFFAAPDGRNFSGSSLLADRERWALEVDKLCRFVEALAEGFASSRLALLGFGDRAIANATALDLQPAYLLYPEDPARRLLRQRTLADFRNELLALPPTSGGDFVDALGDALAACNELYWSPKARKVVLVFGDSPGHSIQYPIPKGGDAGARADDVDVEALRLFRRGVELVTIYHDPDPAFSDSLIAVQREFHRATREQYRRLSSLPELAYSASAFNPADAAPCLHELSGWIGRGGCHGEWVGIPIGSR